MTWSLSAASHTPTPDGADNWEEVEKRLHDELSAVLAKPEYGCNTSYFSGNHVRSDSLHIDQADPAVEHVHETDEDEDKPVEQAAAVGDVV